MRMRNKKNADKRISECGAYLIDNASLKNVRAGNLFDNGAPVRLEIGCGKGGFISKTALKNPNVNFIAVESNKNVMVLAAEKALKLGIKNLKFILGDAKNLGEYFADSSFEKIYLNFSDPWPKARHEKRRLTYKSFLETYRALLTDGGEIQMKTDNTGLFDYSLKSLEDNDFTHASVTYDLHAEDDGSNIMTEYEELFSGQGSKICRVIAYDCRKK